MYGYLEQLVAKKWTRHSNNLIDFTTTSTALNGPEDARFVEVYADNGTLVVETLNGGQTNAPAAGSRRVLQGTYRIFQLPDGPQPAVHIRSLSGTVQGAVIWGS